MPGLNGEITRHTKARPCPVCGGGDQDARGQGTRCFGFISGKWIHCSREEHAGKARYLEKSKTYLHVAKGPCPCGKEHAPGEPAIDPRNARAHVYKYRDQEGKVVFEVVRTKNPKGFYQRRPGPNGKPINGLGGVTPVLYNLPVLKTADPSVTIWVCEGEKDADRLGSYDLVATTNPMGAGKWRNEYAEALRGRPIAILPDNDEAGRKHAREVAQSLQGKAISIKVVELPGLPEKGDVSDWLDAGGTVGRLLELLRETSEWTPPVAGPVSLAIPASNGHIGPAVTTNGHATPRVAVTPTAVDTRPAIEITTEWHIVVEQAVHALARDPDLFRRGNTLGHVVVEEEPMLKLSQGVELRNADGSSRFIGHSDPAVGRCLTRNATFFRYRKDQSGEDVAVNVNPPDWLIKNVATMEYWPGIRTLRSIASCPYVYPDGSIPWPGFDDRTGTLYRPSVEMPSIPDRPTLLDAKAAAERLLDLVDQFPFASEADWSVWLAGILTAVQRPAIDGPVPGIVFNGNKAGVGKGLLVDAIGLIAWGHSIPTRTYPADPIEAGKVKLSLALSGVSAVHFDNLAEGGFFGNSQLDSALTSTEVEGRILGLSRESGRVPLRPCWFLSGNNVGPSKDAYRRWLICNLLTLLEAPDERGDIKEGNLRGYIRRHRLAAPGRPAHPQGPRDRRPAPGPTGPHSGRSRTGTPPSAAPSGSPPATTA